MNTHDHPELVSPHIRHLIQKEGGDGPLARQFIANEAENHIGPEELNDPIGDLAHEVTPGLIHRYPERVLLLPTDACATHCRFCFRRSRPGKSSALQDKDLSASLAYIKAHTEIREVILSGGDPLMLPPKRLASILASLDSIPHLMFLRIHTRIPVTAPHLVNQARLEALSLKRLPLWLVLHINHPSEISPEMKKACAKMSAKGISLLGQTVLLRNVNNDPAILADLFRSMAAIRIQPYYLHHPDLAPGTRHFRVSIEEGQKIHNALRGNLSGFCIPQYVLDLPGGHGKVSISQNAITDIKDDGTILLMDRFGTSHIYHDLP